MLGLIIKDLYNIRKEIVWYIFLTVIFCALSAISNSIVLISAIGIFATISIPLTAIAYEEKDGWQRFVLSCGIKPKTAVFEKYLLGFLFALLSSAAYFIILAFSNAEAEKWTQYLMSFCLQIISLSVVLPVIFKLGVEKGRVFLILLILGIVLIFVSLMSSMKIIRDYNSLLFSLLTLLISLCFLVISLIPILRGAS